MIRRRASALLPLLLLAACGPKDAPADGADGAGRPADAAAAAAAEPASTGEAKSVIQVTVEGGEHAGTYDARSEDLTCSYGLAGKGAWGNQYSVDGKASGEFSSLQLVVPDTKAAASGSEKFLITVAFGPLFGDGSTQYTIDTQGGKPKGSGKVTVEDRGDEGRVTFEGTTADGVKLRGTIDCNTVMRAEG